jgi:8-oxo-dGTP diphosphatase
VSEVLAAGAVLWRLATHGHVEIACVHRPRYDDWSLPKGKLHPGESIWAAAVREVAEETGYASVLGHHLGRVSYLLSTPGRPVKVVDYFAARAGAGHFQPNREVDQLRWLPCDAAEKLLTYQRDLRIFRSFTALPVPTTTMLLVRHAMAHSRDQWQGPDELRTLDDEGWAQVAALRSLLPLFGADRVHSAPPVRCVQTVQDLAKDLGTSVIEEPLLSEQGYPGHETAALARVREIVSSGGTPVVCSQGGVIPNLLARLAADSALPMSQPESAKGSVWVLSFAPGSPAHRLAAVYYIPQA